MQLSKVVVRNEMAPLGPAPRPSSNIYEDSHVDEFKGSHALAVRAVTLVGMDLATEESSETNDVDVISLTVPAAIRFVRLVRIAVASIARRRGLSIRAIDDLRLGVEEAFSLLLGENDQAGSIDVTFEVDGHELVIVMVARIASGPVPANPEALMAFEVVITDLVDRFEADPERGVVQFSKTLTN